MTEPKAFTPTELPNGHWILARKCADGTYEAPRSWSTDTRRGSFHLIHDGSGGDGLGEMHGVPVRGTLKFVSGSTEHFESRDLAVQALERL